MKIVLLRGFEYYVRWKSLQKVYLDPFLRNLFLFPVFLQAPSTALS